MRGGSRISWEETQSTYRNGLQVFFQRRALDIRFILGKWFWLLPSHMKWAASGLEWDWSTSRYTLCKNKNWQCNSTVIRRVFQNENLARWLSFLRTCPSFALNRVCRFIRLTQSTHLRCFVKLFVRLKDSNINWTVCVSRTFVRETVYSYYEEFVNGKYIRAFLSQTTLGENQSLLILYRVQRYNLIWDYRILKWSIPKDLLDKRTF